ncbi:unnamed protein product [Symbiodinium sp. CCMP2456]|nr:unnamed protein product [Symbiodinium sp. CCMP2456]
MREESESESSSSSSDSDGTRSEEGGEGGDVEAPGSDDEAEPADPEAVALEKEAGDDLYPEYPDDESEREEAIQTRTAIMKERAAKKAASTMSLSRSWTRRTSGAESPRSPRSPGRDWAEGGDSFSPKRSEKEPSDPGDPSGDGDPSPRRRKFRLCGFGVLSRFRACGACSRRVARCCRPCVRFLRLLSWLWAGFESRCKHVAFAIRCLCCPLVLLLAISRCCCGSSDSDEPTSTSRSKPVRKKSARSMSRGFSRSGSMAAGRSSMSRSGTSIRFSQGPSHQPKSTIKVAHPRLPQAEQEQKKASARERFRELRREMTSDAAEPAELEQPRHGTLQRGQSGLRASKSFMAKALARGDSSFSEAPEPTGLAALDWTAWLPWNWGSTYEVWKESRVEMWANLDKILDEMDKEDQSKVTGDVIRSPLQRKYVRAWRIFIFAYWDPFLDLLPTWKTAVAILISSLMIIPISGFVVASVLLVSSLLRNMEYVEGDCQIEALPDAFETKKGVVTEVTGTYLIRRFYDASAERTEGFVLQPCHISVPCEHEDIALTGFLEREKCDKFRIWAWRDPVTCYYHQDDEYGSARRDLLCLSRPSDLQEEIFGVVIAGAAVLVAILIVIVVLIRRALDRREAQRFQEEWERQLEKQRAEAEEREKEEEARRQKEEHQRRADAHEEMEDIDDKDWGPDKSKSFSKQNTRLTLTLLHEATQSESFSVSLAPSESVLQSGRTRFVSAPPV